VNTKVKLTAAAAMLVCVTALGTSTAMSADAPKPEMNNKCADILWNTELLNRFPRVAAGCQEVAVKDGKKYARFTAKVTAKTSDTITVRFLNVVGQKGRPITIKPSATGKVDMGGKKVGYKDLRKGDTLTFWVPENRVGVISEPGDTSESEIILK
jgi:hypothetical protein